ncbi:hypothetical protein CAPTEDRAFT_223861 [Capitella teleta]|uniref:Poly [ADP-ribose] polymerase n=1 Tax=Capitella teleta TaxID=283909 RepID=R7TI88_CAPTE|nr:hypothetical protein CAPTEDRAFT_223861 [Capitella teleta]|eukprot:ELT93548.1 hypothetical protein CAPTEDRAFT_223861 [Capitella teleta]
MSDCDFKAEYAKSGRASCKACKSSIAKSSLRLAIMVQVPNWFHSNCFWKRAKVLSQTDIDGFDSLRWEDQEAIKGHIGGGGGGSSSSKGGSAASPLSDYSVEYAKSSQSGCRGCGNKIGKNEVRVSKKDYDSMKAKMYGPVALWHHVQCFVDARDDLEFTSDMDPTSIVGFKKLKKEDQEMLIGKLGKPTAKKRKTSNSTEASGGKKAKKEETEEEKKLRLQSKDLWNIRDNLEKEVSNDALKGLLEYNGQALATGESRLLDAVSDCMLFGPLEPCPECGGQLKYRGDAYYCTGNVTEWTKCQHNTQDPKRKAFKVPKEYHDVAFLKGFKFKKRSRVFPAVTASGSSQVLSSSSAAKPLSGMRFVIGKTTESKEQLTRVIVGMGGKVVNQCDQRTMAVISTQKEAEKKSKLMKEAKAADVHVVSEQFLSAAAKGGAVLLVQTHSLCPWGSDPISRVEDVVEGASCSKSASKSLKSQREEAYFTKSIPDKVKMTVKGGAAVDPDSGLENVAHVLEEKGTPFNAVLGLVDIARGTNSYYKLQILEADKGSPFWVFRAWGRVGTTIGGSKAEKFLSKENAKEKFYEVYADKTGNDWQQHKLGFVKQPNKFYPLDIDYGADDDEVKSLSKCGANSRLSLPVQDLIKLIFDIESMKKAMVEFEIDLKKMPLGKLSKKQIEDAYKVLTELTELIRNEGSATSFLDASNRFYTLIPHDFGMKKPPMLDTEEVVKVGSALCTDCLTVVQSKIDMLDNLLDIEVAYSLLKGGDQNGSKDPVDVHYEKLKTDIKPMDKSSEEYLRLKEYVKKTHAATHNTYDLDVEEIFTVARDGEAKRFRPFRDLHNRQLLWHGSRTTNYAGILSQGLRIAPPEAPVTGYMFGKGLYFADMVSKSANYCRATKTDPTGLLLLCDVALGNMHELKAAEYVQKLPKGKHSTKGCGMTTPEPSTFYTNNDGVVYPIGEGTEADIGQSSLLYNEYIVYDQSQVQIKYMLKVKFGFKW